MTKEDYREKVEEHRQEIDLHNESGAKMSRTSRQRKKSAKKQSNPIMTILTVVLIFIPLTILGYVWLIYEPSTSASENENLNVKDNDDVVLEIAKQNPEEPKAVTDEGQEETDEENKASDNSDAVGKKAEIERLAAAEAKKAEEKIAKEKAADAEEAKKAEEAQKIAAAKAKELEEKKKAQETEKTQQKTHTVQSTDNLYRIALKYYGSGSPAYIDKIKAANNLSSDSISTGQVLIITP